MSASPLHVPLAPLVWMRSTDIAACVHRTGAGHTVTKVKVLTRWSKTNPHNEHTLYCMFLTACLWFNTVTRKPCSVGGHITPDGVKWEEDCNTCHCSNGKVVCTRVRLNTLTTFRSDAKGEDSIYGGSEQL